MPTGLIGTAHSRPGNLQPAGDFPEPSSAPYGRFVDVDRTDDYWISAWSFMRARTAGTGRIVVREYDADGGLLATTTIAAIDAVESDWTRHSIRFGPNDQLGRVEWQADTAKVKIACYADGSPDLTWDVDGLQIERGTTLTAFAPRPQELVDYQIDRTQIADDAVTTPKLVANAVVAGKIAAGAITTEKLAADAVIANVANVGGTTVIDEDGIAVTAGAITVTNPGGTVIIDGTSNMFKVLATGTMELVLTASAFDQDFTSVTLTSLGTFASVPAHLSFIANNFHGSGDRFVGWANSIYGDALYGGFPKSAGTTEYSFLPIRSQAAMRTELDGSSYCLVGIGGENTNESTGVTYYGRYYVLKEAAI